LALQTSLFELVHAEDKPEGRRIARLRDAATTDDERLEHGAVVERAATLADSPNDDGP
jgi:hypothetical protein